MLVHALHVIVAVHGLAVEIQVRTRLQGLWADLFERTADTWGRQIRYGEPPDPARDELTPDYNGPTRAQAVAELMRVSMTSIADLELLLDAISVVNTIVASETYQLGVKAGAFPADFMPEGMKTAEGLEERVKSMQFNAQALRKTMEAERAEQDAHATALRDTLANVEDQP